MNRQEQIEQQTFVYYETCSDEDVAKSEGFIDGAQWADKTMIEKACVWLENNLYLFYNGSEYRVASNEKINVQEFIYNFKQAMEE